MNKKILIFIGISLLLVLIILVLIKPTKKEEANKITPTITPKAINIGSQTGALNPTRTPQEDKMVEELKNLRLAAPIDTGEFIITMNWTDAIFEVKAKTNDINESKFWDWLKKNDYELITQENFKFIK